ncbi:MAG: sulfur carrier protein ThiS [Candidatus Cloacimonadaceae bacterium]|jgi:thiamine biosynthesis protein ThiS|nr:sulfur carrier protein ThiS [Candidatus Cloacimonadota bacterium]MDY0127900.1 sulfur carrier protein ThiS [Candidatus Cloacimonadaceae bacterium]MCB5255797.1 sulfur carrier protein ThiS [Candidatus Cloacimonadota bacterium]MCK9178318.1 sulfur carrier protein ThiS [Candidatus Cloacimonadota bacterium]MCK9243033.1 sulfur carrier protein ThiS [Candidatus Cloacimonadota bacterium]
MQKQLTINGHLKPWREGMTVQDALDLMNYTFRMLVVKINGKVVLRQDYASTQIPEGAEVLVIHMISGG